MPRFAGRTAVISGAGGGIGRACARLLAAEGAQVAALDIAAEPVRETARLVTEAGGRAVAYRTDVTSGAAVEEAVQRAEADLGPITLAVGAAGVIRNRPFLELPEDGWDTTLAVNLKGMFLLLRAVAARAAGHGGGSLVAMASVAGRGGRATSADYAASKAGVISLVRSAALAMAGSRVTVNAVCPGIVDTEMTMAIHRERAVLDDTTPQESLRRLAATIPLQRVVSADEVAETVAYLLSPTASYITGQAINVCGGLEMD